jgi:hypothetical protein
MVAGAPLTVPGSSRSNRSLHSILSRGVKSNWIVKPYTGLRDRSKINKNRTVSFDAAPKLSLQLLEDLCTQDPT